MFLYHGAGVCVWNGVITRVITHKTAGTTAFELERRDLFTEQELSNEQV